MHPKTIIACVLIECAILSIFYFCYYPKISNITVSNENYSVNTILPVSNINVFKKIDFDWLYHKPENTHAKLYSNSCKMKVWVNGKALLKQANTCIFEEGTVVDFAPLLVEGKNHIRVEPEYLDFFHISSLPPTTPTYRMLLVLSYILVYMILTKTLLLVLDSGGTALILLASALMLKWLHQTSFLAYSNDVTSHIAYIAYIADYQKWPSPKDGWVFYHAPLYYTLQAILLKITNWAGSLDVLALPRYFNLACFITFMTYGVLSLRKVLSRRTAYYSAAAFFVFYPLGVLSSSRFDSHMLFYAFYAATIYHVIQWLEAKQIQYLSYILLFAGLALASRSNAYLLVVPIVGVFLFQWIKDRSFPISHMNWKLILCILVFVTSLAISNRPYYYNHFVNQDAENPPGNVTSLNPKLRIENKLEYFVKMDMDSYLAYPYWDPWNDFGGRQYFWNSLLKTSLFGEFQFGQENLARTLCIIFLTTIMLGCIFNIWYTRYTYKSPLWWLQAILVFTPIAALMWSRYSYPYSVTQDFRYIYPVVISVSVLLGLNIQYALEHKNIIISSILFTTILAFIAISAAFYS